MSKPLQSKNILEQIKRGKILKILKGFKISFCAIGQKFAEKNTKKQQKVRVNLLKKPKMEHFVNLDFISLSDNKKIWQIVELFSEINFS